MELAPLEVAIETVETKNSEISSLIDEFTNTSSTKDINPLSMLMNGVIDAAVQGGTVQYKKVCYLYALCMCVHVMCVVCVYVCVYVVYTCVYMCLYR